MALDPSPLENSTIRPTQPLLEVYGAAELRPSTVVASALNKGERSTQFAERVNRIRLKCRFVATTETARIPEDITGRARRVPVGEVNWRTTFRALRHRNYRLFFYGQLVSLIGTWLQQTAMSWFVYEITARNSCSAPFPRSVPRR